MDDLGDADPDQDALIKRCFCMFVDFSLVIYQFQVII